MSQSEVPRALDGLRREYHDATHHCYAYRLLTRSAIVPQSNDAGEPTGSAGRSILQVLEGWKLVNTLVVVVRYFGGIKLGIGGLSRAYRDATVAALDGAELVSKVSKVELQVRYAHELTGRVMGVVQRHRGEIIWVNYTPDPVLTVRLPASKLKTLKRELVETTGGQVEFLSAGR